jgi:hypothetical protein
LNLFSFIQRYGAHLLFDDEEGSNCAQSLVKLNNIEWAMQELDKLERTMNVDACAAILDKVDGPKKQVRRPAKYVFTIKIVEAEEIKACDPNGTSDPYVVLVDEYQKRLHKTRIIMRTLSPRWDESVDVTVSRAQHRCNNLGLRYLRRPRLCGQDLSQAGPNTFQRLSTEGILA